MFFINYDLQSKPLQSQINLLKKILLSKMESNNSFTLISGFGGSYAYIKQ